MTLSHELPRVLLVEDDPDIAALIRISLEDFAGYELFHCSSGADALARIDEIAPDLAILDFSMPGMNGDKLFMALKIRPRTASLPVIFMTASVMPAHVARLKAMGALEVFAKPFDPLQLPDRVKAVWDTFRAI